DKPIITEDSPFEKDSEVSSDDEVIKYYLNLKKTQSNCKENGYTKWQYYYAIFFPAQNKPDRHVDDAHLNESESHDNI
ncbi:4832_t:CDS:2, partial [Funneliformis caledonium]